MYYNLLEKHLGKSSSEFTRADIIRFFKENDMHCLNFRYVGSDGRIKKLSFVINNEKHLETLLTTGERVDGSSLFNYVQAASSDLYVVPKYKTAFVNPFAEVATLDIFCNYYTMEGIPLSSAPENIMNKACEVLMGKTGMRLDVMGELEYYIIAPANPLFPATDQKGYHEDTPFAKWGFIGLEAQRILSEMGANIKYAHAEVGNFKQGNMEMEQYEIEFNTTLMENAALQLIQAKWVLQNLAYKYGVNVSFAPKITVGKAGSGMHIHMKLLKDGKSVMVEDGKLSDTARKLIGGLLDIASSLTAFGNTVPTSYLRLVPHQEAPTNICWGDRNRSVLIRVPLGWLGEARNMSSKVNPLETSNNLDFSERQTVELRCPDCSANIFLLFAGMAVAARHGMEMTNALEIAEKLYVNVNIFDEKNIDILSRLTQLPPSCSESADMLLKHADILSKYDVFSQGVIENIANNLKSYNDKGLSEKLFGKNDEIKALVEKYLYC